MPASAGPRRVVRSRTLGALALVVTVASFVGVALTLAPTAASAATSAHGRILAKPCLDMHSFTSVSTSTTQCIPHDATIDIRCTDVGDTVTGPYGASMIWDVTTYAAKTGYVPDALVYTGTNNPVAPACVGNGNGRVWHSPCLQLRARTTASGPVRACVPKGQVVIINCMKQGQAVRGPWATSTVWDHTTYNGASGYLPDAWVYTATANPVARVC
jgi:uncharacterized protein YraI